ncbi:MAG: extracellular solute-binding protein, partial [Acetatifactor sp.]|nr:extracellular solute-binding protein [Acetatifactor sp.]
MKKFLALGLASAMALSLASCGNDDNGDPTPSSEGNNASNVSESNNEGSSAEDNTPSGTTADGKRILNIGTWWVQHYDSGDTSLEDSEDYANSIDKEGDEPDKLEQNAINRQIFEWKFADVDTIEQKYNIEFYWKNLTYTGVQESINTSILAGTPDCDLYLVDTGMALPAQMNGLALDLKTVLPADADVFTDQKIISYLDMGDGKACILQRVQAQTAVEATYPLAFNMQMLEDYNLEDPRELYARGEWTWDIFNQYCQTLTDDTDGDGQTDQYGFCGFANDTFEQLMMSNGASIATGKTQTLDSAAVGEALQQLYDMYNVYNICYPYDFEGSDSDSMRNQYTQGNIGFFP